jgi:hypothetical protein
VPGKLTFYYTFTYQTFEFASKLGPISALITIRKTNPGIKFKNQTLNRPDPAFIKLSSHVISNPAGQLTAQQAS